MRVLPETSEFDKQVIPGNFRNAAEIISEMLRVRWRSENVTFLRSSDWFSTVSMCPLGQISGGMHGQVLPGRGKSVKRSLVLEGNFRGKQIST